MILLADSQKLNLLTLKISLILIFGSMWKIYPASRLLSKIDYGSYADCSGCFLRNIYIWNPCKKLFEIHIGQLTLTKSYIKVCTPNMKYTSHTSESRQVNLRWVEYRLAIDLNVDSQTRMISSQFEKLGNVKQTWSDYDSYQVVPKNAIKVHDKMNET